QPLDKAEVARLIGNDRYLGGWIDRRAGAVQPLSYARGLARAALNAGAVIHTDTPVTGLKRDGGKWTATTAGGASVTADRVVMCT
ncbi:FAD-binding oxidoreductase, partial [Campylobacter jejuni]